MKVSVNSIKVQLLSPPQCSVCMQLPTVEAGAVPELTAQLV